MVNESSPLLIVADDVGLDPAIDRAASALAGAGLIAVGAWMTDGGSVRVVESAVAPSWNVGLHINLSDPATRPVTRPHPTLCDGFGRFRGRQVSWSALARPDSELRDWLTREVDAQAGARVGATLHVSGHHHIHALPAVARAVTEVMHVRGERSLLVRGFDGETPPGNDDWQLTLRRTWPAARAAYVDARWRLTQLTGFRWLIDPSLDALERDLRAATGHPQSPAGGSARQPAVDVIEWMVHVATGPGASALSLRREAEYQLLAGPHWVPLLERFGFCVRSAADLLHSGARP